MSNESPPSREQIAEVLGLRAGLRIWVGGNNVGIRREMETHLSETTRPPTGLLDAAFITPATSEEAVYFARKLKPRLSGDASLWVVVPSANHTAAQSVADPIGELVSRVTGAGFTRTREVSFRADEASKKRRLIEGTGMAIAINFIPQDAPR